MDDIQLSLVVLVASIGLILAFVVIFLGLFSLLRKESKVKIYTGDDTLTVQDMSALASSGIRYFELTNSFGNVVLIHIGDCDLLVGYGVPRDGELWDFTFGSGEAMYVIFFAEVHVAEKPVSKEDSFPVFSAVTGQLAAQRAPLYPSITSLDAARAHMKAPPVAYE